MRFYSCTHRFYCGVDLHARTISLHILDADGRTTTAKTIDASPAADAESWDLIPKAPLGRRPRPRRLDEPPSRPARTGRIGRESERVDARPARRARA